MSQINGHDIGPAPSEVVNPAKSQAIQILEQVLADVQADKITTIGIVACGPGGFGATMAGPDAPSLNLGIDTLKQRILMAVQAPSPAKQSRILRPGMRP